MNTWDHKSLKNCSNSSIITYRLSIFHGLKEIIFSYIYLFLANSCTDCSFFHLTFSTQREKDLSEVSYGTWKESTRSKLVGTSLFEISPEENTVCVVFAKTVWWWWQWWWCWWCWYIDNFAYVLNGRLPYRKTECCLKEWIKSAWYGRTENLQ